MAWPRMRGLDVMVWTISSPRPGGDSWFFVCRESFSGCLAVSRILDDRQSSTGDEVFQNPRKIFSTVSHNVYDSLFCKTINTTEGPRPLCLCYVREYHEIMHQRSAENEEVEELVASEFSVLLEHRKLRCIYDSARRIENAAEKQESEAAGS